MFWGSVGVLDCAVVDYLSLFWSRTTRFGDRIYPRFLEHFDEKFSKGNGK